MLIRKFDIDRLISMKVLEPISADQLKGHRKLSTRMVTTWRVKPHNGVDHFLRRARFVAREFRWMSSELDDAVFAPASSSILTRALPALLVAKQSSSEAWYALSLDITDAYLTVEQKVPTVVCAYLAGKQKRFRLLRTLPGQRTGAKDWFDDFHAHLEGTIGIKPFTESPALFCIPITCNGGDVTNGGGGLSHVDDVFAAGCRPALTSLCQAARAKYKCSIQELRQGGDEIFFLKRKHLWLVSGCLGYNQTLSMWTL